MTVFELIDVCCEVYDIPDFEPRDGETFCNQAIHFIASHFGYEKFQGLYANEIVAVMQTSPDIWEPVEMAKAQDLANEGRLVIAGMRADPHGHVVVIRPGTTGYSGKWGVVPKVMNIGAENFIGRTLKGNPSTINWCFPGNDRPQIFVLKGDYKNEII